MTPDTAGAKRTDAVSATDVAQASNATRPATTAPLQWLLALIPLVLLGGLLAWIVTSGPAESIRGDGYPPVERLTFQRVVLDADGVMIRVLNDGPDRVHIAQVQIDDAFWTFTTDHPDPLAHLERATLRIPYPWVAGEAHHIRLLTSTGTPFAHEVAVEPVGGPKFNPGPANARVCDCMPISCR